MFGFDRAVAHGMWSMARTLAALGAARSRLPCRRQSSSSFRSSCRPSRGSSIGPRDATCLRSEGARERPAAPLRFAPARLRRWCRR
jgi:hypothetical protein